ncbi:MAG: hypothetical protein KBD64_07045 [Gammaproteobacteria bacterium]|nr:hypothetical protein [Gammaproteobacteria bacterium]
MSSSTSSETKAHSYSHDHSHPDAQSHHHAIPKLNPLYGAHIDPVDFEKLHKNGWVINNGNLNSGEIITIKDESKKTIAVINSYPASESSLLQKHYSKQELSNSWFIDSIWLCPDRALSEVAPLAIYTAVKTARVYNKDIAITIKDKNTTFPIMTLMKAKDIKTLDNKNILIGQKVDYILLSIVESLQEEAEDYIVYEFIQDMYKMFFKWYDKYNEGKWCTAIINKTLTKQQYISTLYNLHSYVQYTTRLCARAIAFSNDAFLRNNYIEHFRGEINHEILIEKDLQQLGEDVEYLKKYYIPNIKTKAFMTLQESTIGFYQDPVLLLACPFVAEGVSANFRTELLDNLEEIIGSWGIKNLKDPGKAMRFLNSHVKFDGGEDGHWKGVIEILPMYVKTEFDRQRFISIAKFGMDSILNSFDSNVDENLIW